MRVRAQKMLTVAWRGIHGINPGAPGSAWDLCGRGRNGVRDHVQGECHTGRAWMSPATCSTWFKFCSKFPTKWNGRQGYSCEVFCNVMRVPAKWLRLHVWFPGSPGRWVRTFLVLAPSRAKEAPPGFCLWARPPWSFYKTFAWRPILLFMPSW